ncbi:MAG: prolyl oligopeptidase family serine peptidase [Acidobacteria bacterium]|nr:prolyl oligopeptidase family serine peptidase [Acidobacteriota bacterium]
MIQGAAAFAAFCPAHRFNGARSIPIVHSPVVPQDLSGDRSIRRYLADRAAELEREFLPGIKRAADFEEIRPALREDLFDMLGLKPMPERSPLNATVTGRIEQPGYTIEKLHFQSLPGLYVTANLYLPRPLTGRSPAILYQVGHYNQHRRDGNKAAPDCIQQGIWFATHGYVALMVDTLELSEIAGLHRGLLSGGRWWWYSTGYTPAGVETWNAIRAIDYLVSRPDVDANRIGATGISGGGIGTFWIAAVDERVKAAAPVSGMGDLTFYAGEDGISRHCDCFFFYNRARWHWTTVCSLLCPRPMLFANSDNDPYFPMANNERIINRLERLYSLFGASDQIDAVISVGGHGYRTDLRRASYEFFNRHLKDDARRVVDPDAGANADGSPLLDRKLLRVFPEDTDIPKDHINTKIDELFVTLAKPAMPAAGKFELWQRDLLDRLRKAAFTAWPTAAPAAYAPALGADPRTEKETPEAGIEVHWRWIPGKDRNSARWLIVLNPDEDSAKLPEWAREIVGEDSVLLLNTRGIGPGAWTRDKFPNPIERSMALLGGTVDGGRIWDIITIAGRYAGGSTRWRAAGRGSAGILAAYAALYQPAIEAVAAVTPPASHRPKTAGETYGPPLLNMLRVMDIPEALGCLAPRRLTLIGANDSTFERTVEIYRLAGAADRLERKN